MKYSDALAAVFREAGVGRYFAVTGGAAVHLIDSLEREGLPGTFAHHEQGAALSADAFARVNGLGLCVTTTGPGVTNALTGTLCSWQDSVPTVFLSGQSRSGNLGTGFAVRQAGTQHLNVGPIVSSIVKEFYQVDNPEGSLVKVASLIQLAQQGRQGPIWIDVPLDIQLAEVGQSEIDAAIATLNTKSASSGHQTRRALDDFFHKVSTALDSSKKPIVLFGNGMKNVPLIKIRSLFQTTALPFVTTWGLAGHGIEHLDGWVGRIGVSGMRGANKAAMESDVLMSIGARFGQSTSGTNLIDFAPLAQFFQCDIDEEEVRYTRFRREVKSIVTDSEAAIDSMTRVFSRQKPSIGKEWLTDCQSFRRENHSEYEKAENSADHLELYRLMLDLHAALAEMETRSFNLAIDGGGTVVYASMQAFMPCSNVTQVLAAGPAPMGTGIPHGIGLGSFNSSPTIVLVGDGSLMFNIQEIQTAITAKLEMTILVLQNNGYTSIRSTQNQFLESRYLGSSGDGGLEIVDLKMIAGGFGIPFHRLSPLDTKSDLKRLLTERSGVRLVEVPISESQEIYPRVAFQKDSESGLQRALPLNRMFPLGD